MGIRSLLRRALPSGGRQDEARLSEVRTAVAALRQDLRALRKDLAAAQRQAARAGHQAEQLLTLRQEDESAGERLDRVAPVMDLEGATRHVRDAIAGARRVADPFPHLLIAPLVPAGVYGALLEAVPPRVFFARGRSGFDELRIPPELAPLYATAVWRFFARLVKQAMAPALLQAFAAELGERHSARTECTGRLVWSDGAGPALTGPTQEAAEPLVGLVLPLAADGPRGNAAMAFAWRSNAPALPPMPTEGPGGAGLVRYELVISARFGPV